MEIEIKSRHGKTYTFSRPGSGYIFCDMGDSAAVGTLGQQICHGGRLSGSTISYRGESLEEFAAVCRQWYRAWYRREKEETPWVFEEMA